MLMITFTTKETQKYTPLAWATSRHCAAAAHKEKIRGILSNRLVRGVRFKLEILGL